MCTGQAFRLSRYCFLYCLSISSGALRQHLMSMLRKQVYERRAEERRAAEEVRRMYDEDLDDEEEEREMTGV